MALVIALTIVTVWLAIGERLPGWLRGEREITVRVAPVRKSSEPQTVRLSGVLRPVGEIQVVSLLPGRVTEIRVKAGDTVRAGAVLAIIHASEITERQAALEAALSAARKDLAEKERQLGQGEQLAAQHQELFKQDLIARREVEKALSALPMLRAEVELGRAHLTQQEAMLAQALKIQSLGQITAPSTGVVTRRWVEPGASLTPTSPIVSIASGNLIKLVGRLTGAVAGEIREGLSAVVLAGERVEGIVSRVVASADKPIVGADVEIQFKSAAAKLRVGMAADAEIALARAKEILRVPQSAVVESGENSYVYKVAGDRAMRHAVRLGDKVGDEVVVEQGIGAADLIVIDKLDELGPSSRVRPVRSEPAW
jgi:RND family efflux transporter MFP subunit